MGSIPACAGPTGEVVGARQAGRVHPRVRGADCRSRSRHWPTSVHPRVRGADGSGNENGPPAWGPSPRARGRHLLTWEFTRSMGSSHSVWRRGRRGCAFVAVRSFGITASGCGLLPSRIYQVYGTSYRRSPLRTARRIGGVGSSYWCSAAWASVIMSLGGDRGRGRAGARRPADRAAWSARSRSRAVG